MTNPPDPFVRLHDALVASATRQAAPARNHHGRRSRRIAAVAAVGMVAAGTGVAATTPWNPRLGGGAGGRPASRATTPVPAELADALGVLRRPQIDADRDPSVQRALGLLRSELAGGVFVDGIRRLRERPTSTVVLVPMRRFGPRNAPAAHRTGVGLCVYFTDDAPVETGPRSLGGASCGTLAELRRRGIGSVTAGLVPDGVARVRVTLNNGKVLTAEVVDNYYELPYRLPEASDSPGGGATAATRIARRQRLERQRLAALRRVVGRPRIWLDADGDVVPRTSR